MKKRILIPLFIILALISIFVGVHDIAIMDIIRCDTDKLNILSLTRIPRLISIVIAAVAMSIAGVIMQQISNNKFVSPTTAATVDSAMFGVLISMLIFNKATLSQKMLMGFIFALIGTFLFITDFFAYKYDLVQVMSSFTQGKFSMVIKGNYEMLYLTVPLIIIAALYANKFTIIGMGEDIALNLGINYSMVSNIGLIIVAILSAIVVITVGNIPFIGLIVPNIVSLFNGDNVAKNIWNTALFGACFVLIFDIIGRIIIFPYEIPISLTVGVIGSIIFLYLIFRRKKNEG